MLVEDSSSDEDEEVVPNASATRPRLSNADEDEDDDDDDVFVDDPNIVRGSGDDVNVRTGRSLRVGQGRIGHALRT